MRRFTTTFILSACVAAVCANPARARADDAADAARMVAVFTENTREYVKRSPGARAVARQGDIFSPKVAKEFHVIIRNAFKGKEAANMRRTIRESEPVRFVVLRVNNTYPEDIVLTTMPPTLLNRLPRLPDELAYRIIGRALILQDLRTSVIVDILPDAIPKKLLPRATSRKLD
jgi:hypothetical protein